MIYDGEKDIAAAGTAEALASARVMAVWVTVQAKIDNTNAVRVGGKNASVSGEKGVYLLAGDAHTFPSMGGINAYDLQHLFVDVGTNGEGVTFTYGRV